ncbi:TPA: hypothetical protein VDT87_005558 [Pseudomonas aeruginosa]|nr:hypothetical protein [Pseudomonas aeruginosa]
MSVIKNSGADGASKPMRNMTIISFPDEVARTSQARQEFEMELSVLDCMLYALTTQVEKVRRQYKALSVPPKRSRRK